MTRQVSGIQQTKEMQSVREEFQQHREALSFLYHIGQALSETLDVEQAAERLLREVTCAIGAEGASLWLWDEERDGQLSCRAIAHGDYRPTLDTWRLGPKEGIAGWVAHRGESFITNCAPQEERFFPGIDQHSGFSTESLLAVPLRARGKVLGVLEVVNKREGDFATEDLFLVEALVASAAVAIDNARLIGALNQRADDLEARNKELDAFAHTVAHDIRGSLGLVIGFADALEKNINELPKEELQEHLGSIQEHGRKIEQIVDGLLLLAGAQTKEVEKEPLNMAYIVKEVIHRRLAPMIDAYGARITLPRAWPVALGYGAWVEEVWSNYISNALKYGGSPPQVELGGEVVDGMVCFWVRDNGPGLTSEKQEKVFTPLTRLSQLRNGNGLGLSIARHITERLDGQVGVDSAPGQGATFWFTLPMVQ